MDAFDVWHNEIMERHYESERQLIEQYENRYQDLLRQKWITEDRLKIATSYIPLRRMGEYLEEAYGRKN